MKCPDCNRPMARDWLYCPYDGTELEQGSGLPEIINKVVNGIKRLSKKEPVNMGAFTIKIKTGPDEKVIASGPIDGVIDLDKPNEKKPLLKIAGAVEPKTKVKRIANKLEIIIELPGVKSLNDVDLTHLGESLEVRARAKDKGYFKVLSVPENYVIINKSISNEKLSVRMSERHA